MEAGLELVGLAARDLVAMGLAVADSVEGAGGLAEAGIKAGLEGQRSAGRGLAEMGLAVVDSVEGAGG